MNVHWNEGSRNCVKNPQPPLQEHRYNPGTVILRENLCTTSEAPFLYLLIGSMKGLLIDTGDIADSNLIPLADTVMRLLPGEGLPTILSRFLEGWVPFRRAAPCGSGARLGCRAQCSMTEAGIKQRSRTQHGAQHGQQPIRHAAQSTSVRVAPGAQPPIVLVADGIVLHAHARPMIGGVAHPRIAAPPHAYAALLAALPRQRRDSG